MTPIEFKAWFDGFTEAMDRLPTKAQWARIKERVAEIDGKPITERVFVDRWSPYWHYLYPTYTPPSYVAPVFPYCGNSNTLNDGHAVYCASDNGNFDSCVAMTAIGRAEAAVLTA